MQILIYPLRDMQDQPARAYCIICGAELFEFDGAFCSEKCKKEFEKHAAI